MSQPTNHRASNVLGRWEWVALPEFGIACIKARIDLASPVSTIRASDVTARSIEGLPFLCFRILPVPEDPRAFVMVEARRADTNALILTQLTIGEESFPVSLEVVETPGDFALTLGHDTLGQRFRIDASQEAVAGPPNLGWVPRNSRHRST